MPCRIDTESRPTVLIEETQPILTSMRVDASFANTRDRAGPHQRRNLRGWNVQEFAEQYSVDQNVTIGDFNLHHFHPAGIGRHSVDDFRRKHLNENYDYDHANDD